MAGRFDALRSVRGRITLISTALVAVTLILASLVLVRLVRNDLLSAAEDSLEEALEAQAAQFGLSPTDLEELDESFDLFEAEIGGEFFEVGLFTDAGDGLIYGEVDADGVPVAEILIDADTGEVVEIFEPGAALPAEPALAAQLESLAFEVMELSDAEGNSSGFLVGAQSLDEIEESIDALADALVLLVPVLLVVFATLIWWLVGRALQPMVAISRQVEAISTSSLDQRVPVPTSGDEVANLARVMNRMLARLERGGERQRQFSADASHELRSPLATIRAAAEMLGRSPGADRAGRLSEDVVAEADRMEELIADLLELSRLDEGRRLEVHDELDLRTIVSNELASIPAGADGPAISLVGDAPVPMVGSTAQLRRLVRNLVDNAVRHADGRVTVSVGRVGDAAVLTVDDDGSGVPPADREVIFERFSRLDEARSRDDGGSGLGLALVKQIAEAHCGTIAVSEGDLGGARFEVRFPPPADLDRSS